MSQVKIEEQIGGVIMHLKGQFIGGDETEILRDAFAKFAEGNKTKLVINMEKVSYLNSTALGVLISGHSNFAKRDGIVVLCNVGKSIENLFVITKLALVFKIANNLDEAIQLISK